MVVGWRGHQRMGKIAMGFRRIGFVLLVRCSGEMIINNKIFIKL